jgi:protein-S-isoprenylcysteine O-methyltransferase Ste14
VIVCGDVIVFTEGFGKTAAGDDVDPARTKRRDVSPGERRVWRWSGLVVAMFVIAPIAAAGTAFLSFSHPLRAVPRAIAVLTTLLLIAVLAGIALGPVAIAASRNSDVPRPRRIIVALTSVASCVLAIVLWYWNLLMPWSPG